MRIRRRKKGAALRIYGRMETAEDVSRINRMIRKEIRKARSRPAVIELYKRSMYLITLTHPNRAGARKAFGKRLATMHRRAKQEFTITAKLANKRLKALGELGRRPLDTKWGPGR